MWKFIASEVGGRVSCAQPIQNEQYELCCMCQPLACRTSCKWISLWTSLCDQWEGPCQGQCDVAGTLARLFFYGDHWTETHYHSQWQHGMIVGCPVAPLKGSGGSHVLGNIVEPLMCQPSCRVVCNLFCYNGPAVGEAHRCHVLIQLSCSYEHECSAGLVEYHLLHDLLAERKHQDLGRMTWR